MQKFFKCEKCGKIIAIAKDSPAPTYCCGEEMKELVANTTEAALEKHIPEISVNGNVVTVAIGSVLHPMLDVHYIEWISLETKNGNQRKILKPGEEPKAIFALIDNDEVIAAYAYCNLHGLWKKEL